MPKSRNFIIKKLIEAKIKNIREACKDPRDKNGFITIRRFIKALPPLARIYSTGECVVIQFRGSRDFKDYITFVITRYFNYLFYLIN